MSRLMDAGQHQQLMLMRGNLAAQALAGNSNATQRCLGMVQGFLLGLHAAGEIEFGDVQALEDEVVQSITFLVNAREGCRAH